MLIKNGSGPRTDLWGTLLFIGLSVQDVFETETTMGLFVRKSCIQCESVPEMHREVSLISEFCDQSIAGRA